MSNSSVYRAEHLIVFMPLLTYLCTSLYAPHSEVIISLAGELLQIKLSIVSSLLLLVNTLPYCTHFFLRTRGAREALPAHFHIIVSLVLSAALVYGYSVVPEFDSYWGSYIAGRPGDSSFVFFSKLITTTWWMLLIVHLLFMLYAVYRMYIVATHYTDEEDVDSFESL